jgi:penicillin-binding protein 1A
VASLRPRLVLAGILTIALAIWVSVGSAIGLVVSASTQLPDSAAVQTVGTMPHATTLVDAKGRHAFTIFQEQRLPVPLSRISPHLVSAIVAIEDQRFYQHGGFDVIRVLGAGWNNVLAGRAEQGGSTITQQLARLSFLTPEKTLRRKLQEVILATRLERAFSKDQILEMYLNKAYFGDGLYGVEAASLGYFGKHAFDVYPAEAALLAGLVKAPSTYAPTISPERAVARRNIVLRVMHDSRVLDAQAYEWARNQPLTLDDTLRREEAYGQYFKEEVRKEIVERFGWDRVYQGGLNVETTLDLDVQKAAEAEVARALGDIEQRLGPRALKLSAEDPLQAALVALDPRTGEVRALVGGRDFEGSRFNRVTQAKRQPGSAFKPFVYAAALEEGYTPGTILRGLAEPVITPAGAWIPEDGHVEEDALPMRAALRVSSNRAAVRMLEEVGVGTVVRYADRFGMTGMPPVPSLALGSGELTMLSLVSAFGVFANAGTLVPPTLIRRVTDSAGEVLYEATPQPEEVVSPTTAYLVTSMLEDVVDAGTGAQARQLGFRLPAAGKTGTTNEYRDAWFIGYTPQLIAGVWVGHDRPRTIVQRGYAAQLAVPLWTRFMIAATRGDAAERFTAPATVTSATICPISGRLATDACRREHAAVYTEYFERGTEPIDFCPYHILHSRSPLTLAATTITPVRPSAPAPPSAVAPVPAAVAAVAAPQASEPISAEPQPPAPPKKRGFWSRVFGVNR